MDNLNIVTNTANIDERANNPDTTTDIANVNKKVDNLGININTTNTNGRAKDSDKATNNRYNHKSG